MADPISALEASHGTPAQLLDGLIDIWRERRHPTLAQAIATLSRSLGGDPIVGASISQRKKAWNQALEAGELEAALVAFPIGGIARGLKQLKRLKQVDDPRVADRLLASLADPPYRSPAALAYWTEVLAIVEKLEDPRSVGRLQHHAAVIEAELAPPMGRLVKREIEASLARSLELDVPAWPEAEALLARLRERYQGDAGAEELLQESTRTRTTTTCGWCTQTV